MRLPAVSCLFLALGPAGATQSDSQSFEKRLAEVDRQAAAFHVELGRWMETQGQAAWAKYQYGWALQMDPENKDAKAKLARPGEWKNKVERTKDADPKTYEVSLVKVWKNSLQVPGGNTVDWRYVDLRIVSKSQVPLVFHAGVRSKINGATLAQVPQFGAKTGDWRQ